MPGFVQVVICFSELKIFFGNLIRGSEFCDRISKPKQQSTRIPKVISESQEHFGQRSVSTPWTSLSTLSVDVVGAGREGQTMAQS